jgi:hypothetical protein
MFCLRVLYAKHPRRTDVFVDGRYLPQIIFQEKVCAVGKVINDNVEDVSLGISSKSL